MERQEYPYLAIHHARDWTREILGEFIDAIGPSTDVASGLSFAPQLKESWISRGPRGNFGSWEYEYSRGSGALKTKSTPPVWTDLIATPVEINGEMYSQRKIFEDPSRWITVSCRAPRRDAEARRWFVDHCIKLVDFIQPDFGFGSELGIFTGRHDADPRDINWPIVVCKGPPPAELKLGSHVTMQELAGGTRWFQSTGRPFDVTSPDLMLSPREICG